MVELEAQYISESPTQPENTHSELRPKTEIAQQAIAFFADDLKKILADIVAGKVKNPNTSQGITVRCCMFLNPEDQHDVPVLMTRPDVPISIEKFKSKTGQMYELAAPIDDTIHSEIWCYWEQLMREDSTTDRSLFFQKLLAYGGIYKRIDGILKVKMDQFGHPRIKLENGFLLLNKFRAEEKMKIVAQLGAYSITHATMSYDPSNIANVEKYILEFMLSDFIRESADKLAAVVTPKAVKLYRNLAFRFMTNPDADRSTVAYTRFQEFQELLKKL